MPAREMSARPSSGPGNREVARRLRSGLTGRSTHCHTRSTATTAAVPNRPAASVPRGWLPGVRNDSARRPLPPPPSHVPWLVAGQGARRHRGADARVGRGRGDGDVRAHPGRAPPAASRARAGACDRGVEGASRVRFRSIPVRQHRDRCGGQGQSDARDGGRRHAERRRPHGDARRRQLRVRQRGGGHRGLLRRARRAGSARPRAQPARRQGGCGDRDRAERRVLAAPLRRVTRGRRPSRHARRADLQGRWRHAGGARLSGGRRGLADHDVGRPPTAPSGMRPAAR